MEKEKKDDTARLTAEAIGVSAAYVRMVVKGTRENLSTKARLIIEKYNEILEAKHQLSQPVD